MEHWVLDVDFDIKSDECFVKFPEALLSKLNWKEGTILVWTVDENDIVSIKEKLK